MKEDSVKLFMRRAHVEGFMFTRVRDGRLGHVTGVWDASETGTVCKVFS